MDEQNQPNQPDLPEIPNKNHLPKWSMIIVIAVGIIAIGIVGYFCYQNYFISDEPAIEDPTADLSVEDLAMEDWQTYRNEEYGFEVKYPEEADVSIPKDQGVIFIGLIPVSGYGYGITIDVIENYDNMSAKDWYSQYYSSSKKEAEIQDAPFILAPPEKGETTGLNEYFAYKINNFAFDHTDVIFYVSYNNYIYRIQYNDETANDPDWNSHRENIDQILSTFKFIE